MRRKFQAFFERDNETGMIMTFIPEIPKAFTVGKTLEEARQKVVMLFTSIQMDGGQLFRRMPELSQPAP